MTAINWLFSRGFTVFFLFLSVMAIVLFDFDANRLLLWFLLPFYFFCLAAQFLWPHVRRPLEKGELATDLLSNSVLTVINAAQGGVLAALFALGSSSILIQLEWIDPQWGLGHYAMWLQVLVGVLLLDLFFYITHRMAHEVPFLWRFHSVHHCAHRVTFLNAYRAHPLDAMFRRFVPLFFVLLTGISEQALAATAVIGSVLGTITHLNMNLKHGWLNYFIGTNEVHRWHHSADVKEAKNFAIIMIWDHLFGTFYYPRDRIQPERIGLSDEDNYPCHSYFQQLLIPFRWKRLRKVSATES